MYIATQLLIASLNTAPATTTGIPDLCDIVDQSTGVPTICKPHKEGGPIYNANLCCAGSSCFPTSSSRCPSGQSLYYCGVGERTSTGAVDCYFEVPNYCDVFACETSVTPPPVPPAEDDICCHEGVCWGYTLGSPDCELGDLYWCNSVVSNADGTVTCVDWEG